MQNYGEALKYQRETANLTQPELAKKIGTSQQNLSRWERNEVIPNIDFCVQLAKFYGITLDELVGISEDFGTPTTPTVPAMHNLTPYSSEERELIKKYRELNAPGKKLVNTTINTLLTSSAGSGQNKIS